MQTRRNLEGRPAQNYEEDACPVAMIRANATRLSKLTAQQAVKSWIRRLHQLSRFYWNVRLKLRLVTYLLNESRHLGGERVEGDTA